MTTLWRMRKIETFRKNNSKVYWEDRAKYTSKYANKSADVTISRLFKTYNKSLTAINKDIEYYLMKHSENQQLTIDFTTLQITGEDRATYETNINRLLKQYEQIDNRYTRMDVQNIKSYKTVTKYQALENEVSIRLGILANQTESAILLHLQDVENFTINKVVAGFGIPLERTVQTAVNMPWSGKAFSDRIWDNKGRLIGSIRKTVNEGVAQGKSIQRMAKELKYRTDNTYSNAERIIRTETNYILNESTRKGYQVAGVEYYEVIATNDDRTRDEHQDIADESPYRLIDAKVGTNYPPLDPNCRCSVIPVI